MAERGQATVELVAALPALLLSALVALQLLAAGYALTLADGAAEAGALALASGGSAAEAARGGAAGLGGGRRLGPGRGRRGDGAPAAAVAVPGGRRAPCREQQRRREAGPMTVFDNPLKVAPMVLVTAVGEAEGSRGAAAALACAGADADVASLLIEVGGRAPRPTLIASAAAQQLESRLKAQVPDAKVAARGQVCHLVVPDEPEGLEIASGTAATAREGGVVVHLPPELVHEGLTLSTARASAVLLRADLDRDRALVALAVRDLLERGLTAAVLKQRLSWVAERRALFGVLPPGAPGGLPVRLIRQLTRAPL